MQQVLGFHLRENKIIKKLSGDNIDFSIWAVLHSSHTCIP